MLLSCSGICSPWLVIFAVLGFEAVSINNKTEFLQNTLSIDEEVNVAWRETVEILGRNTHLRLLTRETTSGSGNLLNQK